jgi:RNA-binding protein
METKQTIELRKKALSLNAHIRIGKNGINENIVNEISKQLLKHKLIKIKFLKSILPIDKESLIKLSLDTKSEIVENKGNTLILFKR